MSLLSSAEGLEPLHSRRYETDVYLLDEATLLVRGAVSDTKPPGMYVADDPEPLEIHQMHVELTVALPDLEITTAAVVFETHPHESCPTISSHYEQLVGLNIARGFTHKVRELFGGPRGCTHTTALLQSMAPAVVQSLWSVQVRRARLEDRPFRPTDTAERERHYERNINSCHVWDEAGEEVARLRAGDTPTPPLQITRRLRQLGRDPAEWFDG